MISNVPGGSVCLGQEASLSIHLRRHKCLICHEPIFFKAQVVRDQRSAEIGVISNSVPANPWVYERKRKKEKEEKEFAVSQRRGNSRDHACSCRHVHHVGIGIKGPI